MLVIVDLVLEVETHRLENVRNWTPFSDLGKPLRDLLEDRVRSLRRRAFFVPYHEATLDLCGMRSHVFEDLFLELTFAAFMAEASSLGCDSLVYALVSRVAMPRGSRVIKRCIITRGVRIERLLDSLPERVTLFGLAWGSFQPCLRLTHEGLEGLCVSLASPRAATSFLTEVVC